MRGPSKLHTDKPALADSSAFYALYKSFLSGTGGDRCSMLPSCSTYAEEAFTKHGQVLGFLLMFDRLSRCGNDLDNYAAVFINHRQYFVDPVEAHIPGAFH